jgi:hypothetical protein
MFPFDGERSTPNDPETAECAIVLLQEAFDHEKNGIAVLERLSDRLQQIRISSAR